MTDPVEVIEYNPTVSFPDLMKNSLNLIISKWVWPFVWATAVCERECYEASGANMPSKWIFKSIKKPQRHSITDTLSVHSVTPQCMRPLPFFSASLYHFICQICLFTCKQRLFKIRSIYDKGSFTVTSKTEAFVVPEARKIYRQR